MDVRAYAVELSPNPPQDGGGFSAFVADLPGCMSDGATPEEALANAYDAIQSWIEAAEELGRDVPLPRRLARLA